MRIIKSPFFSIIFILLSNSLYAQLTWNLNFEPGYFIYSSGNNDYTSKFGAGLDWEAVYKFRSENRLAVFGARTRPEIYDLKERLLIIKLKAAADYYQFKKDLSWAIKVEYNRFHYNITGDDQYNSSIFLTGEIKTNYFLEIDYMVRAGYSNRSVETNYALTMDIAFANLIFYHTFSRELNFGYGINFEKFIANNEYTYNYREGVSVKGYRYGPQLSLTLNSDYILRGSASFLIHTSEETSTFSYEQQLNLVFGKSIIKDMFFLLYLQYYHSDLNYNEHERYLYFQSNYENTVYLKLSYDLSDLVEIYLKPGYRQITLTQFSDSFDEWHFLAGIGITN